MGDRQRRVHNIDEDLNGPEQWFRSLPIVTRHWLGSSFLVTCAGNFEAVGVMKLIWNWKFVMDKFEVWRGLTSFLFVGGFSFNTLISFMLLHQFSKQYESGGPYNTGAGGGTADYVFMLMLGMAFMLLSYPFLLAYFPLAPFFGRNLIFYVLYVWSKRNPTAPANIWGVGMKGMYLPFAYLFITVVMGSPWYDMAHGIAAGHIYYFLVDVVPIAYGKDILHTPQILIDYFGIGEYTPANAAPAQQQQQFGGFHAPGRVNAPRDPAAHDWGGGGRRLGD